MCRRHLGNNSFGEILRILVKTESPDKMVMFYFTLVGDNFVFDGFLV